MDMEMESIDALERVFHEPSRMAIVSVLCASRGGMTFTELRDRCGLTDGNLNRHVKMLETDGIVRCVKAFVDAKPRTTVKLTASGTKRFKAYLDALETVLKQATQAIRQESKERSFPAAGLAVRA